MAHLLVLVRQLAALIQELAEVQISDKYMKIRGIELFLCLQNGLRRAGSFESEDL